MPTKIILKNSTVKDKAPLPADLDVGELAVNLNKDSPAVYGKDSAGNIVKLAGDGAVGMPPDASETAKGIVELATAAETTAGTSNTHAVHPAGLKVELDKRVAKSGDTMTGDLKVPNLIATADVSGASATIAGNVQAASINSGPLAGFRNAIINGNFSQWQRGASFTDNDYSADRWVSGRSGTTHQVNRFQFTTGQTDVPDNPVYYIRTAVTSVTGAANFARLEQRIENVRTFSNQQVTISFWTRSDAPKNIAVDLFQNFGTGGSAQVTGIVKSKAALTSSWSKVTFTATVPSITGKTIGAGSYLALQVWFDAGSAYNSRTGSLGQQSGVYDIAQVQIEPGPVATPFERRPDLLELFMCQRYYEISSSNVARWAGMTTSGSEYRCNVGFKIVKRSTPTIVLSNVSPARGFSTTVGSVDGGLGGFRELRTSNATVTDGLFQSTWVADAEL